MEKTILKSATLASLLLTSSFQAMAVNLQQDTFPYIACSVIEASIANKGGDGNTALAGYYVSGGLINEYFDRGHSLDEISVIMNAAALPEPSQEKQYHQSIVSDLKEATSFFRSMMKDEGVNSVSDWEYQRDNEWMCIAKVKPNLMAMNDVFQFMN